MCVESVCEKRKTGSRDNEKGENERCASRMLNGKENREGQFCNIGTSLEVEERKRIEDKRGELRIERGYRVHGKGGNATGDEEEERDYRPDDAGEKAISP